jgi:hypothetical protein
MGEKQEPADEDHTRNGSDLKNQFCADLHLTGIELTLHHSVCPAARDADPSEL